MKINDFLWQELISLKKMPQSGVGSMQGKNTGNMPSAVCASSNINVKFCTSCLRMKMSSSLFVRAWAMPRIL